MDPSQVVAVKAPGFGERKSSYLEDIAILTGGTVVRDELGVSLDKATEDVLGVAAKVGMCISCGCVLACTSVGTVVRDELGTSLDMATAWQPRWACVLGYVSAMCISERGLRGMGFTLQRASRLPAVPRDPANPATPPGALLSRPRPLLPSSPPAPGVHLQGALHHRR